MLHLVLWCAVGARLAQAAIHTERFDSISDEMPTFEGRSRRPKIIGLGADATITLQVPRPNISEHYNRADSTDDPVESVATTDEGRQLATALATLLARLRQAPVVLLAQDEPEVLRAAAVCVAHVLRNAALRHDFWLMKYNASGVSGVIAQSAVTQPEVFRELVLQGRAGGAPGTRQSIGARAASAASFFGLLKATRALPRGAAIVLFTDAQVEDEDLALLAVKEAQQKEVRVFVVWQGAFPSAREDYKLLREAAERTHGAFLVGGTQRRPAADGSHVQVNGEASPVVVHLTGARGRRRLRVPIESGASAMHVSLSASVATAQLRTPDGYLIDLLNATDVARYARNSYALRTGASFECELALSGGTARAVGVWQLEVDAPAPRRYDVVVSARHALTVRAEGQDGLPTGKRRLHLRIDGAYARIDNVTLITPGGERLGAQKLRISVSDRFQAQDDIETLKPGGNVDVDLDELPGEKFYIQLHGTDATGNAFQRVAYYDPRNVHRVIEPTTIELGEGSELAQVPGQASNILYRVTNHRDNVIFMRFQVTDERAYLRSLSPQWAWLSPHQSLVVMLQMISRGADDAVTFTAWSGSDRVDKKAIVRSRSSQGQDAEAPHMWHKFTSNCQEVIFSSCEEHSWTAEVTAQDRQAGLLLVQSSPEGLYFPQGYTSGTTEEVMGVLSGSCCQPGIVLTAIDLMNNRRSYEANAYWAKLGSAAIAAIVISIVLLCTIIGSIIYCCICGACKRKQKASHDIPGPAIRYRGPENSATTARY